MAPPSGRNHNALTDPFGADVSSGPAHQELLPNKLEKLVRKAIKLFVVLAIGAAVIAAWWLSRTNDLAQRLQDLFSFIN